jgi:hypothetical protein
MHPQETVMRAGRAHDAIGPAEIAIHLLEPFEEPRERAWTDGDMIADPYVPGAQFSRDDANTFAAFRVFGPQEVVG